jgi:hypothetical protein
MITTAIVAAQASVRAAARPSRCRSVMAAHSGGRVAEELVDT